MPAAQHCPEVRSGRFTNGAEVNMDEHEQGEYEARYNVKQVGQMQSAGSEYLLYKNQFRVDHGESGNDDDRHEEIQYRHVTYFLQRIEFTFAINRVWSFFSLENAEHVIPSLVDQLLNKAFSADSVKYAVFGEDIAK